jgi:uncharacterized membrane protein
VTLAVFLACDALWLSTMGQSVYRPVLGDILLPAFQPVPALLFYILYSAGIVIFAVRPGFVSRSWLETSVYGALYGLFAYATYDLTNMATLRHWTLQLTLVDLAWGSFVTAVSATAGFLLSSASLRLFKINL